MICGKQVFLSQFRREEDDQARVIELLLPPEVYWQVQDILKETDYLIAQSEDAVALASRYVDLYRYVMPYAVHEKDRLWLINKTQRD